jgi:cysteine desulfurase/selenocysteine lyase
MTDVVMFADALSLGGAAASAEAYPVVPMRKEKTQTMFDVKKLRADFPALAQKVHGKPLVYLDSAATAQKPRKVIEVLRKFYEEDNSNVHRGIHALAERATAAFEEARGKVARMIGAPGPENVVWTRGSTEGVNLVAYAWARRTLQAGDEILLTPMEHHSNLVPWQMAAADTGARLRYIPMRDDFTLDLDRLDEMVNPRTRLVAITHVSNVLGTINPVAEIAEAARSVGAKILVDAAQSVPHMPVDVKEFDPDFMVFSGHKMLGPTGIGVLYGRMDALTGMEPFHGGGEMILEVQLERSTYKDVPYKFEAGTPPIAEAVGLGAAVDYLLDVGMENIHAHETALAGYAMEVLGAVDGLTLYGPRTNRGGEVSFGLRGIHPHDLATIVDTEGVAIRAGHHCAQPLMRRLGVGSTARASFYLYNTRDEVDALVRAIDKARSIFGSARQTV